MNNINNPYVLLSFINTHLRDDDVSLDELCERFNYKKEELLKVLETIGYHYDEKNNQFK